MRIALFSDVHANLPALEAVLGYLDTREPPVDAVYHLGDLVGYAPWPDEVVSLLHDRSIPGVAGNYDSTVAVGHDHCGCRYEDPRQAELSHVSFEWTVERVGERTRELLGALPFRLDVRPLGGHAGGPTLFLFHAAPTLNTLYWTEDRDDDFCAGMAARVGARPGDFLAFGHTHVPWHRTVGGVQLVNTGSAGRPKDGDPRACVVLVEMDAGGDAEVRHVRVEYDVERAARGVEEAGLPGEFATILRTGGSFSG